MKEIIINSKRHGIKKVLVSDCDFALVSKFKWSVFKGHSTFYCLTPKLNNGVKSTISMHRFIKNAKNGEEVDHRNHNGLDNRRSNLRICTDSQNSMNMRTPKDNTTWYKGVSLDKRRNKFHAHIFVNKKNKFLGYTKTAKQAAVLYNNAAKLYFKEFAKLNQI